MGKYDDIINLDRPESKHPKMSKDDRAKIFSSFAALKGYEDEIDETNTAHLRMEASRVIKEEYFD